MFEGTEGPALSRRFARSRLTLVTCALALTATALFWTGAPSAEAQAPQQVTFGLEGCRITPGITLPINGQFVCPDSLYTSAAWARTGPSSIWSRTG